MKKAVMNAIEPRGVKRTAEGGIELNNPIAGVNIKMEKFEKIGCVPPNYGPGYFCSYNVNVSMKLFSNEGSERATQQIDTLDYLLRRLAGGNGVVTERVTKKFVWSNDRWIIAKE